MQDQIRLSDNLAYLLRSSIRPPGLTRNITTTNASDLAYRRLFHIKGIGRLEKSIPKLLPQSPGEPVHLPSEDMLIGLYGSKIKLAFLVTGDPNGVGIYLGTWYSTSERATTAGLDARQEILNSALGGLYPSVDLSATLPEMKPFPCSGFALGVPTAKPADAIDGALPLDRLIRAMSGGTWACLVLADPVNEVVVSSQANALANEIASASTLVRQMGALETVAEQYMEFLKMALQSLNHGRAVGAWRTAAYLMGDQVSYYRLASLWQGIFSGDQSLYEPLRVWEDALAGPLLASPWAMPDAAPPAGPGRYNHLLSYQSLLTSAQLAAYMHLPQQETIGFAINLVPNFDSVPQIVANPRQLSVGTVIQRTQKTQAKYAIDVEALTGHVFISGVTGAGKSNTVVHLLKQADQLNIPFLVVEPAKAEYRSFLTDPTLVDRLQIFTLGEERVSPFRINPFEVIGWPDNSIGVHLDLLRSVFNASFGMWTPLPQILEQCLHKIYRDRGWDITTNKNGRLDRKEDVALAFPTLSELVAAVDDVLTKQGWDDKITSDIRASLQTRLNGLRMGGKGRMLDVQRSLPMEMLLKKPTVLELENMGDDDDKAFMIGLLLIRLAEYRRKQGQQKNLQHLLVIEEAHRLLTNVGRTGGEEQAAPRAKAVEAFSNMLSEVRAYGQGVIIADQVPVKLAPDAIKNTNLKIAHRIVAEDDRRVMAGAMAMDERQTLSLATFTRGQAAIFSSGDDTPVLVQVDQAKGKAGQDPPNDAVVKDHMDRSEIVTANRTLFRMGLPDVDMTDPANYAARDAARALAGDPSFKREFVRFITSVVEDPSAFARLWGALLGRAQAARQRNMDERVLLRCLLSDASDWFAARRGSQYGWTFSETSSLRDHLRAMLFAGLESQDPVQAMSAFRSLILQLTARTFEPFPGCDKICANGPRVCLYRHSVADRIAADSTDPIAAWRAVANDPDDGMVKAWELSKDNAYNLIEYHPDLTEGARRIALCYSQHMLTALFPEIHQMYLNNLIDQANEDEKGDPSNE